MAAPITFSGLASGLDTTSIISSIVAAAKAQDSTLTTQQGYLTSQNGIVTDISSKVAALGTLAQTLTLQSDVALRTSTVSDSHVQLAVSNNAVATTHDIRVDQLAQSQVVASNTFASDTAGIAGTGGLTITTAGGTPQTISYTSTDTLDTIASKINSTNTGVNASVLYDGSAYRLVVTNTLSGTANAAQFSETGSGLGLSDPSNIKIPAQDAKVTIDGVQITRSTNVIDDAIPGVTLTAVSPQATTDPDTSASVQVDTNGIATQLQGFVTAYNTVQTAISAQLTYTGTAPSPSGLFGDSTLRELQSTMASLATAYYGSTSLSAIGMTIDENGQMTLDTSKLTTALAADPHAVDEVFATSKGAFAKAVSDMSNSYTDPIDGALTTKGLALTAQSTLLQNEIDQIDTNATALQTRLQNEFNALESTMSQLKNEGSFLTQEFSGSSSSSSSSSSSKSS